jgi:Spy/CpxP family protein refolding chaperone
MACLRAHALALTLVTAGVPLVGCSTSASQVIVTPATAQGERWTERADDDDERLPRALEALDLSDEQQRQVRALGEQLKRQLEPMRDAGFRYGHAVATTVRRCKGKSMVLDDAASWLVVVGEQSRGPLLDAIDRLHAILTPAQRRLLVQRLQRKAEERDAERDAERERAADRGTRSLGDEVDLSFGQTLRLLAQARALQANAEERLDPWRSRLERAVKAFGNDDFRARDHAVAEAPLVREVTVLVAKAARTMLPILEQEQCKVLGERLEQKVSEAEAEAEARGAKSQAAAAER